MFSVALFKPDLVARSSANVNRALALLESRGFTVLDSRQNVEWNREQAAVFYKSHEGKWYLERLVVSWTEPCIFGLALVSNDSLSFSVKHVIGAIPCVFAWTKR